MLNNFILQHGTEVSIILRIVSIGIALIFVLPLQIKEATVKNGLFKLRKQLLAFGTILLLINLISTIFLIAVHIEDVHQDLSNSWLQFINAIANFMITYICHQIYYQQYTPENKRFHKRVEILEKREEKTIANQETARVKLNKNRRADTVSRKRREAK